MKKNISIFLIIFSLLSFGWAASSFAAYVYYLDRFELTGTQPPTAIIDEFNDNSINSSLWEIYDPTVVESGGTVSFSNPGTLDSYPLGKLFITSEMSYLDSRFSMVDGGGNYTATSTWTGVIPLENQFYIMNHDTGLPDENTFIGIFNWDTDISNFLGTSAGLMIFFGRIGNLGTGDFEIQEISLDPTDITGNILLRMAFNDTSNEFSGSYSLDGGTTFVSPFDALAPPVGGLTLGDWTLGAESWEAWAVPVPSSFILLLFGIAGIYFRQTRS